MARAEFVINALERFGGYTLATLLDEDAELIRLIKLVDEEREAQEEVNGSGE